MYSPIDRSNLSTKQHVKKCRVCGEMFTYYPYWHQWMAKVNGSHYEAVCRYNCMRTVERRNSGTRKAKEELQIDGRPDKTDVCAGKEERE